MALSFKNYKGERRYYKHWLAAALAEADKAEIQPIVRDQITDCMCKDAWRKGVRPEAFVASCVELLDPERGNGGVEYDRLCGRLFASPLYARVKNSPAVVKMLIQRVYDCWLARGY